MNTRSSILFSEDKQMEVNSDVLELIVSKLDNNSIQNLSLVPGIWNEISLFANKQHFWFLRTEELISRDLSWKEGNWKEAYYILVKSRTKIDNNEDNPIAAAIVLELGVDPTSNNNITISAVCSNGHVNILRVLLEDGRADPSANYGSPIAHASSEGHVEVVRLLLEYGVDPSSGSNESIETSSSHGRTEVVKLLLQDKRVDPSANNNRSIKRASMNGHIEVVRLLLQDDRVIHSQNIKTDVSIAIGGATNRGHSETADLLEEWLIIHLFS